MTAAWAGALSILTLSAAWTPSALGQGIPPELPMIPRLGVGARALGLAGAYTAVAADFTALYYNPAGLAQIGRSEFGLHLDNRSVDWETTYLGNTETTPLDKTRLQAVGFAYPFPTYRGSMVLAIAYHRVASLDLEYFRAGADPSGGIAFEEERIIESGSLGAYQAGLAWDISPKLSLGVTGTILSGSSDRERTFEYDGTNEIDFESTITETYQDITAISGTLGALYDIRDDLSLGLALHLPESYDLDGEVYDDVRRYQAFESNGGVEVDTLDYIDEFRFEDDITLPFRISAGLAFRKSGFLVSADVTYADWKAIDYAGEIRTADRDFAYRSTLDLRLGAEYTFRNAPLRLRAGFVSQPVPYDLIATDVFLGQAEEANFDQDRRFFTLGAGVLLDRQLMLDGAYSFGGFERSGRSAVGETVETVDEQRLTLAATFRLAPQ